MIKLSSEPDAQVVHPGGTVGEVRVVGPAVAAFRVDVQGGGDAVGAQGFVVADAVLAGDQPVVGVGHDESGRGVGCYSFLVAVCVKQSLGRIPPQQIKG